MFNGLGLPAIDQTGGSGLYFGGGDPYGFAFGVTNTSPRVTGFFSPNAFDNPVIESSAGGGQPIRADVLPTDFKLVAGDGPPPATQVAQTAAQTMAGLLSTPPSGLDSSTLLLLGGGIMLLLLLSK